MSTVVSPVYTVDGSPLYTSDGTPIVIFIAAPLELVACTPNISIVLASSHTEQVTWNNPSVDGGVAPYIYASNYTSGAYFPVGLTTVTTTVTDQQNTQVQCSFTITISVMNRGGCVSSVSSGVNS